MLWFLHIYLYGNTSDFIFIIFLDRWSESSLLPWEDDIRSSGKHVGCFEVNHIGCLRKSIQGMRGMLSMAYGWPRVARLTTPFVLGEPLSKYSNSGLFHTFETRGLSPRTVIVVTRRGRLYITCLTLTVQC